MNNLNNPESPQKPEAYNAPDKVSEDLKNAIS